MRKQLLPILLLLSVLLGTGCRQGGGLRMPWQQNNSPWQNPATASNSTPSNPASSESLSQLADLLRRQDAQSQLSITQRRELERLTELQRETQQQLAVNQQQKQVEQLKRLQDQAAKLRAQQQELEQFEELRRRALQMDENNRDLHTQLARSEQERRLVEDQLKLLQTQLSESSSQLANALRAKQESDTRMQTLQASNTRRGSATITANNSLRQSLSAVSIAGISVRQDGDVIRMELPSDQLFQPQTATIRPEGLALINQVAAAIANHYPRQVVGVESHTDNGPISPAWRSNHQLSAAQAMAVFDQLTQQYQFGTRQLFVLGHGPNYPIASNATPAGQQKNRRVEVVIYPETVDQAR
ncbi:MAG: OmpA family protein [Pirellulaceae bacterium]